MKAAVFRFIAHLLQDTGKGGIAFYQPGEFIEAEGEGAFCGIAQVDEKRFPVGINCFFKTRYNSRNGVSQTGTLEGGVGLLGKEINIPRPENLTYQG